MTRVGEKGRFKEEIRTCKFCGGMFRYYGFGYGYCERCTPIDNEMFHRVKDYIWENGTATMAVVSDATGVSMKQINQYLRDGRLEIPEDSEIFIRCELCGTDIRYGRYCQECASRTSRELKSALKVDIFEIGEKPKRMRGKMHYLSADEKNTKDSKNGKNNKNAKK